MDIGVWYLIGIDWSRNLYVITILNNSGECIKQIKVKSDYEGFQELLNLVKSLTPSIESVTFNIEEENLPLVDFLIGHGYRVYYTPPKATNRYRDRYTQSNVKSDFLDSFILADLLRNDVGNLSIIWRESDLIRRLKALVRDRNGFVKERTRLVNRLIQGLQLYYPEFLKFFEDPSCPTALAFLTSYPTFEQASKLNFQQLKDFFFKKNLRNIEKIEHILKILNKPPTPVNKGMIEVSSLLAQKLAKMIEACDEIIDEYEAQIEELFKEHPDSKIFGSLPSGGSVLTAGLLTIFGDDRSRYNKANDIQAIAGTAPITRESGFLKIVKFRVACNHFYRYIIQQFSFCTLKKSLWAKWYYYRKLKEGKSKGHALRCLANLWIKILFKMWKDSTTYNENLHLANMTKYSFFNEFSRNQKFFLKST